MYQQNKQNHEGINILTEIVKSSILKFILPRYTTVRKEAFLVVVKKLC